MIIEIHDIETLVESVAVIRQAFQTVADDLSLTETNAPSNPAFMTVERLQEAKDKGVIMFGLYDGGRQIGFAALEKAKDGVYYLERLAVLPSERHKGYGKTLMDFAFDYVTKQGGTMISIGIINENTILKDWYVAYGFVETSTRTFEHLPFTVCFMSKDMK